MVKKISVIPFLFMSIFFSHAQNLVPNSSFEFYSSCPNNQDQLNLAVPWFKPTLNTPDYFNACSSMWVSIPDNFCGYQFARTGQAYAGFGSAHNSSNGREYIEVRLTDSLIMDRSYCVTFYVSLADTVRWATSRVGAYISHDSIYSSNGIVLNYVPQIENPFGNIITDEITWTKVSGTFTAAGGEKFITIGNFYNDVNTDTITVIPNGYLASYYYIDDVSVYELPQDSMNCFDGLEVEKIESQREILLYPNPVTNELKVESSKFKVERVEVYDVMGGKHLTVPFDSAQGDARIDVSGLAKGIYFVEVRMEKGVVRKKIVKM